jgi:uncharacterized protein DUF6941
MRATMMLADHAQIADGKLFISGGGWTTSGPGPTPCAVVTIFHVPWDETEKKMSFVLRLVDEDGQGVFQPGSTDGLPVQVHGAFEAHRQPGMTEGSEINVPMAFNIVLQLPPGGRYTWLIDMDGQDDGDWSLTFETRQARV